MENIKMTKHAMNDRTDRLTEICLTCGVGEVIYEKFDATKQSWSCVTDTGVILIKSANKKKLITAYIATRSQLYGVFDGRPPQSIINVFKRNEKRGYVKMPRK